ncbi:MAG: hypothetical protein EOM24_26780 [Chloroflexia bacterium]|nr:hypothetical protein [Chloroflexia bacterium]
MKQLWKSHRVFGYEVTRAIAPDGTELVILQTAPHHQAVSPTHLLMPVAERDLAFEAEIRLTEVIERCKFLGMDVEQLRSIFEAALAQASDDEQAPLPLNHVPGRG